MNLNAAPEPLPSSAGQLAATGIRRTRRQRRPTGAPPPLPRQIAVSTTAWLVLAAVTVTAAFLATELTPWRRADEQAGSWLLGKLAVIRTPWLTDLANGINAAGLDWHLAVGVAVVVLIVVFR